MKKELKNEDADKALINHEIQKRLKELIDRAEKNLQKKSFLDKLFGK
ncbi:hypothetical protein ABGT15_04485 [Flavobacterium enshiense]